MLIHAIQKSNRLRSYVGKLGENRAKFLISFFDTYLPEKSTLIDVGAGVGNISRQLMAAGHKVTPLDIKNLSMVKNLQPIIYDGRQIPYKQNAYDVGLLITVLHHVPNFEQVFDETVRVSKRIIIIEDVYKSRLGKWLTFFFDSLINLEFRGHPHNNKTDEEWRVFFKDKNITLIAEDSMGSYCVFKHKVYILESKN